MAMFNEPRHGFLTNEGMLVTTETMATSFNEGSGGGHEKAEIDTLLEECGASSTMGSSWCC